MQFGVSHDRSEEDIMAKAAWFQSLPLEERMALLCEYTDLILENNPGLAHQAKPDDPPPSERIRIVSLPRS
jgi:hypothetical protein